MRLQEPQNRESGADTAVRRSMAERAPVTVASLQPRDAEWLDEMKTKMAAVEAWRGFPTHHVRKPAAS